MTFVHAAPKRIALAAVVALCWLLAGAITAVLVHATGPTVTGAGSTWVQIALDQWRADIAREGYTINYQGVGSSAGREFFIINQVDFAASEIPFYPSELQQLHGEGKSFQYLPDVAGGTTLMYNLHTPSGDRITNLRLDATTAAKIFTGRITSWQDAAIRALNPGLQIAETTVIPVIRSDGSGTSAQFSLYLATQASGIWNAFVSGFGCPAPCSQWPPFPGSTQQSGSDGVANFVANDAIGQGAIGYVEAGYAFGRGFPIAHLHNSSGNFTPSANDPGVFSNDVATALAHATLNADLTQNLGGVYNAPESNAYPMSSYSYLITQTTGFDPAKGNVLGTWLLYIACAGQQEATPLGYSPLPPNLVSDVFHAEQRIPGAPPPPPIDPQHCPNPTVTGTSTTTGGPSGGGGSSGGGGGGGGGPSTVTGPQGPSTTPPPAGPTGSTTGLGGALGASNLPQGSVPTMNAAQRQAAFALAEAYANRTTTRTLSPLFMAGGVVLAIVFGPLILLHRRGS